MLEAKKILMQAGYIVKTFGLNFKVTTSLGISSFMTISELIETAQKVNTTIL